MTTTENRPTKTRKEAREETDAWLRHPIGNADTLTDAIKLVEMGLAQVSEQRVDGQRIARMVHLCKMAAQKNPTILDCTRGSLVWSLLDAARVGLEPDGEMGALVPYKSELRFQPMYKGLIHLIAESNVCHDLDVRAVFRSDHYEVDYGTTPRIVHKPDPSSTREWGELVAVYVVFRMRDGSVKFDEMNRAEIEKRRNGSRAKDSGPWSSWPVEMAKKTVIKRGIKTLPRVAPKVLEAIDADNRAEASERYLSQEDDRITVARALPAHSNRGLAALGAALGADAAGDRVPAAADDGEGLGQPAPKKNTRKPANDAPAEKQPDAVEPPAHKPASAIDGPAIMDSQRAKILDLCDRTGATKAEDRLRIISTILGVQVSAVGALSVEEGDKVIAALEAERAKRAEGGAG